MQNLVFFAATTGKSFTDKVDITEGGNNIKNIVLCVLAGFAVALVITYYSKIIAGKGVKLLFESGAFSPESAKTLRELGLRNIKYHSRCLEKSNPQKRICVKIDGDEPKYYIAEEQRRRAERTYISKENALGMTVISVLITAIVFAMVYLWGGELVDKIQELVNSYQSSDIGGRKTDDGGFVYEDDGQGDEDAGEQSEEDNTDNEESGETEEKSESITEEDADTEEQNGTEQ